MGWGHNQRTQGSYRNCDFSLTIFKLFDFSRFSRLSGLAASHLGSEAETTVHTSVYFPLVKWKKLGFYWNNFCFSATLFAGSAPTAEGHLPWPVRRCGTLCLTIWEIRLLAVIASDARWKRFCLRRTDTCSTFGVLRECAIQIHFYLLTYLLILPSTYPTVYISFASLLSMFSLASFPMQTGHIVQLPIGPAVALHW